MTQPANAGAIDGARVTPACASPAMSHWRQTRCGPSRADWVAGRASRLPKIATWCPRGGQVAGDGEPDARLPRVAAITSGVIIAGHPGKRSGAPRRRGAFARVPLQRHDVVLSAG